MQVSLKAPARPLPGQWLSLCHQPGRGVGTNSASRNEATLKLQVISRIAGLVFGTVQLGQSVHEFRRVII